MGKMKEVAVFTACLAALVALAAGVVHVSQPVAHWMRGVTIPQQLSRLAQYIIVVPEKVAILGLLLGLAGLVVLATGLVVLAWGYRWDWQQNGVRWRSNWQKWLAVSILAVATFVGGVMSALLMPENLAELLPWQISNRGIGTGCGMILAIGGLLGIAVSLIRFSKSQNEWMGANEGVEPVDEDDDEDFVLPERTKRLLLGTVVFVVVALGIKQSADHGMISVQVGRLLLGVWGIGGVIFAILKYFGKWTALILGAAFIGFTIYFYFPHLFF